MSKGRSVLSSLSRSSRSLQASDCLCEVVPQGHRCVVDVEPVSLKARRAVPVSLTPTVHYRICPHETSKEHQKTLIHGFEIQCDTKLCHCRKQVFSCSQFRLRTPVAHCLVEPLDSPIDDIDVHQARCICHQRLEWN